MARPCDAQGQALHFLTDLCRRMRDRHETRLPNAHVLARMAGVSHVSILAAAHQLRDQGVLRIRPRTGMELLDSAIPHDAAPRPSAGPKPRLWEKTAAAIRADMVSRRFGSGGALPPRTELCDRYGVNPRTLRKALASLVGAGELRRERNTLSIGPSRSSRSLATFVLITPGTPDGRPLVFSNRMFQNVRAVEQECRRTQIGVEVCRFHRPDRKIVFRYNRFESLDRLARERALMGAVIFSETMSADQLQWLIARCRHFGLPTAVFFEAQSPLVHPAPPQGVWYFAVENGVQAGRKVGEYLGAMGHRRVAYVSPLHARSDSRARLQGLRGALEGSGGGAVISCTAAAHRLRDYARPSENVQGPGALSSVATYNTQLVAFQQALFLRAPELLAAVEGDREVTACVVYADFVLEPIMDQLLAWRRAIPRDVSVVSFDDSETASVLGATSFSFNDEGAIREMLWTLLNVKASDRSSLSRNRIRQVEGFVTQRGTTAGLRRDAPARV